MSPGALVVVLAIAATATAVATPPLIRWLHRRQVLDVPNIRSSHVRPTPRGGGLAVLLGVLAGLGAAAAWSPGVAAAVAPVLVAVAGLGAVGLGEDLVGLSPSRRLVAQLGVGAATAVAAAQTGWPGWAVAGLPIVVVVYVNAFNFMDGVNAISGLNAAFCGAVYAVLGWQQDTAWIAAAGLALVGSSLGFLPFNAPTARVFLGDSGSYALGGLIAVLAAGCLASGAPLAACLAPVSIYLADTGVTLLDRIRRGQPVQSAHRDHTYQALSDRVGHLGSALVTVAAALLVTVLAAMASTGVITRWLAVTVAALIVLGYLGAPRLLLPPRLGTPASDRLLALSERARPVTR